ncbi:ring-cleaving dioxygenase [Paenibacillus taichungensis]|uniref:Ring-cleaving dioxygenase n=1 Tax=Paenibacillus taichungensis TaxID=484184 RepID=A0A329R371_9BACL|nr:ring-cleaving dioxygenase [Paenibacillus taichungensis]RAW19027.1 ring-cleaving dioxygenase [Paenibacillus taichungensis]
MIFEEVKLYTAQLEDIKYFYINTLGLNMAEESEHSFTLQIGLTKMIFMRSEADQNPFYHFAWMIPANRFQEAKAWAAARVRLSRHEGEDETYSTSWNSNSLYFEDPVGNILELIAHHTVLNESDRAFSEKDLLQVCEVGLVTEDVLSAVDELEQMGLKRWRAISDTFAPVGDVNGLFIVVKKERTWFFSEQKANIYPLEVFIREVGRLRIG